MDELTHLQRAVLMIAWRRRTLAERLRVPLKNVERDDIHQSFFDMYEGYAHADIYAVVKAFYQEGVLNPASTSTFELTDAGCALVRENSLDVEVALIVGGDRG